MTEEEAIQKWEAGYWREEVDVVQVDDNGDKVVRKMSRLEKIFRQPATELKGTDDPDLWAIILYTRAYKRKEEMLGQRTKPGLYPDEKILATPVEARPEKRVRRF